MKNFSRRLQTIEEYVFSRLAKKVKEVEQKTGKKVLNLGPGSPDVPPHKEYLHELQKYIIQPGNHMYPGYGATPELNNAVIQWYKKRFNVYLKSDELFPILGAKDGIVQLSSTLLDKGDEVLIPDPGYPGFTGATKLFDAKPVYYPLTIKNNFTISIKELEKYITKKTKLIWVNYPSNPTGQVITEKELQLLVQFALSHGIWIAYDNAYSEITFDGYTAPSILKIKNAVNCAVEVGSFSKTFSFAGFRIGWIAGNKTLIQAFAKIKSNVDSGMTLPFQQLATYALTHEKKSWHIKMIRIYENRRKKISLLLNQLGLKYSLPKGSLYIWAEIPSFFQDSETYALHLLESKQILVTPGTAFGKEGKKYIRVSICSDISLINTYI